MSATSEPWPDDSLFGTLCSTELFDDSDLPYMLDLARMPHTTGTLSATSQSDDSLFGTLGSTDHWDYIPDVPQHTRTDQPPIKKPRRSHSSQERSHSDQQYNVYCDGLARLEVLPRLYQVQPQISTSVDVQDRNIRKLVNDAARDTVQMYRKGNTYRLGLTGRDRGGWKIQVCFTNTSVVVFLQHVLSLQPL